MAELEQPMTEAEKRIFKELTFIAEHNLYMEGILREILFQLEGKTRSKTP